MKKFLLPEGGSFYKANLHTHTNNSDGKKSPEEIKEIYKNLGYSVVAYTDHDILLDRKDLCDDNFLALNGYEAEVNARDVDKCCHICFIALEPDNLVQPCWHRSRYLFANAPKFRDQIKFDESEPDYEREYGSEGISDLMTKTRNKGFFVTYNHPSWSLEDYRDYMNYEGMHAFEMFNGSCICSGYQDYNPRVYDDMLFGGKRIYCIGADDNHNFGAEGTRHFDSGLAWTMIKADKLDYRTITKALEDGHFYASEGPEIHELWYEDGKVHVKCSEADKIVCNFGTRKARSAYAENGVLLTEAEFEMPEWKFHYLRITVTDKTGKHACTNAYFEDELK